MSMKVFVATLLYAIVIFPYRNKHFILFKSDVNGEVCHYLSFGTYNNVLVAFIVYSAT